MSVRVSSTPLDLIESLLEQKGHNQYVCPAHDDNVASLSLTEAPDGMVLLHCHAGCTPKEILDSLGMSFGELYPEAVSDEPKREIVARYVYVDEDGANLFEVRRYSPKSFSQHRWSGMVWESSLGTVRRVPYHLPNLLAQPKDSWVFIVEGEKDVERLEAEGFIATTIAGGSQSWSDEYVPWFSARRVVVIPDNDQPGEAFAAEVSASIGEVADEVRIVRLPGIPKKGDISDYFNAGGTSDDLKVLVSVSPSYTHSTSAPVTRPGPLQVTRAAEVVPTETEWFWPGRIPFGKITIIDGNPGQGKSTMTLDLVARASIGGLVPDDPIHLGLPDYYGKEIKSILLSAEDGLEDTIVPRLMAADANLENVLAIDAVKIRNGPDRPWQLPGDLDYLRDLIVETGARIVVIDPLMAYLEPGVSSNNDQHVRRALHPLKMLADDTGVAMIIVRHLRKSREGIAMLQGGGSVGIIGAARAGLVVGTDPNDPTGEQRVVAVSKMNLGKPAESLAFHLENTTSGAGRIVWDGPSPHTAETLLTAAPITDVEEVGRCSDWLKRFLDEPQPVPEILGRSRQLGWSDKVLAQARRLLGVIDTITDGGMVYWGLPKQEGERKEYGF